MIRNLYALAALAALSVSIAACAAPTESGESEESTEDDLTVKSGHLETFQGQDDRWYFRLVAGNEQIVLGSQSYSRESSAKNGAQSVVSNGLDADNFELREAANGSTYFVLKAANHQVIGQSEQYSTRSNAQRGVRTVRAICTYLSRAQQ